MSWTEERTEQLRALWIDGRSASEIVKVIGGTTREAVLGKVNRMGLSKNSGAVRQAASGAPRLRSIPRPQPKPRATPHPRPIVQGVEPLDAHGMVCKPLPTFKGELPPLCAGVEHLTSVMCRWPVGDPQHADFGFCGRPKELELSYCAHHHERGHSAPPTKAQREAAARMREAKAVLLKRRMA